MKFLLLKLFKQQKNLKMKTYYHLLQKISMKLITPFFFSYKLKTWLMIDDWWLMIDIYYLYII